MNRTATRLSIALSLAVLSFALVGCGGNLPTDPPTLEAFAGPWAVSVDVYEIEVIGDPCHDLDGDGIEETCDPPKQLAAFDASVSVNAETDTMTVTGICEEPLVLGGSISSPYWTGQPTPCKRFARAACDVATLWVHHVYVAATDGGLTMLGSASGSVDGCGTSTPAIISLRGQRPQ